MSRTADIPSKQLTSSLAVPHKRARSNTFGIVLFDTAIMTEHSRSAADVGKSPNNFVPGWLELKRMELSQLTGDRGLPPSSGRIEVADLRERVRKLEAIAAGIDI